MAISSVLCYFFLIFCVLNVNKMEMYREIFLPEITN